MLESREVAQEMEMRCCSRGEPGLPDSRAGGLSRGHLGFLLTNSVIYQCRVKVKRENLHYHFMGKDSLKMLSLACPLESQNCIYHWLESCESFALDVKL